MYADRLKKYLSTAKSKYVTYPKFVFLCGKDYKDGFDLSNRGVIEQYISTLDNDIKFVLSECVLEHIFDPNDKPSNLVLFEEVLAELSDAFILFLESMGTSCELGAFTYDDNQFKEKLIIVEDIKFKNDKSFLNQGAIAKAKANNSLVLYSHLDNGGLLSSNELRLSIKNMIDDFHLIKPINRRIINLQEDRVLLNSFAIEMLELISLFQPISKAKLLEVYKYIKGFKSFTFAKSDNKEFKKTVQVSWILALLNDSGLIDVSGSEKIITSNQLVNYSFMFDIPDKYMNKERSWYLSQLYKPGKNICLH